ncbi:DNA cytosine methyltransferase [Kurthia huakuii]|uniref:DNA cytosine methyltransferase n=1 Tax=Kurthia huakuii TaxID=1421019 RepID=UPI000498440D|nr:DNA cytosine methyltransferase [Kurthia huakuii]MBM7701089.1 DNA (cytosine-5)-methyltransferase 1 [Kurthia huakuii]
MFKSFDIHFDKKEEKQFIEWITDIYKHLEILQDENNSESSLYTINNLIDLGIIKKEEDLEEFKKFFYKKMKTYNWEKFINLISSLNHDEGKCEIPKLCNSCRRQILEESMRNNRPTLVDLFCGSGGMSLGFNRTGFKTVFANDIEPSCIETYLYNHPEVNPEKVILGDIQDIAHTVQDYTEGIDVDVVIGGPPCQGFSNANKQRVIDDPRNRLYREYVEVVSRVRPRFFVMENVIGMKNIAAQIIEDFNASGYDVEYEVFNALDFGVPQNRKRIIFIGNRVGIDNSVLISQIKENNALIESTTLESAIADLPILQASRVKNATSIENDEIGKIINSYEETEQNPYLQRLNGNIPNIIYNHKARFNNDRDIEIFSRLFQGDKSDDPKIADIMPYKSREGIFKDKYFKLVYNQPCKTITAHMKFDCNMYIHPTQARGLTPREAARVQSYPDDYYFKGSFTKTYMQIGNAVPPLMAEGIANVVINYIN